MRQKLACALVFRQTSPMSFAAPAVNPIQFARLASIRGKGPSPNRRTATIVGGSAVFVWATAPSLATIGSGVGALPFVAGSLAFGFVTLLVARPLRGQPVLPMLIVPLPALGLMVLGFLGHNGFFMSALLFAPAGEVTVISYLWPVLVIALQSVFAIARPSRLQWIGVGLGFGGFLVFAWPAVNYDSVAAIEGSVVFGLTLALAAALSFATYSALRPRVSGGTVDAVGTACGVAAIIAAGLHVGSGGGMVDLDASSLVAMILLGAGPMGLANLMWDHGVRNGDGRVLSACAYLTPILSTSLLVLLGLAVPTIGLAVGGTLIIAGVCLGAWGGRGD